MIESIEMSAIDESPTNPRKIFNGIDELAADIAVRGLLQPILLRPRPRKRFELVFGSRRFRAAKSAGLQKIDSVVRDMEDRAVVEAQVAENQQREDIHPLEEADGYRQLIDLHGATADEIALLVGKSRSYVYERMRLNALCGRARSVLLDGRIPPSTALLVARLPTPVLQMEVVNLVLSQGYDGEPMTYREAKALIEEDYMLRLDQASFPTELADLVPKAGPCQACPKRTGAQAELFPGLSKDICTDPPCFKSKVEAEWARVKKQAKADGAKVLSEPDSQRVFPYGGVPAGNSGYVDLDLAHPDDRKKRTYRELFGEHTPEVTVARDRDGKAHDLVRAKEAKAALKAAGHKLSAASASSRPGSPAPGAAAARLKARIDAEVNRRTIGALAEAVSSDVRIREGTMLEVLRLVGKGFIESSWSDTLGLVAQRRGLDNGGSNALFKIFEKGSPSEVVGLLVELAVSRTTYANYSRHGQNLLAAGTRLFDVDTGGLRGEVSAELRPKAKPKSARKKTSRKKAAGKGTRKKAGSKRAKGRR